MQRQIKISVIILTVNGYTLVKKSLASLVATGYRSLKLLVFDNGSRADLAPRLKSAFPQVETLRSPVNLGFAAGANRAISYVMRLHQPDYILLFNNDALALKNLFRVCLPYLQKRVDLLSPTILLDRKRGLDNVGLNYYRSGYAHARLSLDNQAQLVSGCCLFLSASFIRKNLVRLGWIFNPLFFSYVEDLELALPPLDYYHHLARQDYFQKPRVYFSRSIDGHRSLRPGRRILVISAYLSFHPQTPT